MPTSALHDVGRSGGRSSGRCLRASCGRWRRPMRWSWAWMWAPSTPHCTSASQVTAAQQCMCHGQCWLGRHQLFKHGPSHHICWLQHCMYSACLANMSAQPDGLALAWAGGQNDQRTADRPQKTAKY